MNAPLVRLNLDRVLRYIRGVDNLILQSMFVTGSVSNIGAQVIDLWMEAVGMVKPQMVHLYTLDRKPLDPGIQKVDEETLDIIAMKLKRKAQIESLVFP